MNLYKLVLRSLYEIVEGFISFKTKLHTIERGIGPSPVGGRGGGGENRKGLG